MRVALALLLAAAASGFAPAAIPHRRRRQPCARAAAVASPAALLGELTVVPSERVVGAVAARSGGRVTAADVAAASGAGLAEARRGLTDLASALAGVDGVSVAASDDGELVYSFPTDVRAQLSARSSAASAREAWNKVKPGLQTAGRVAFGVALLVSIAVIFTAITVISSSSSSDDRDDRRGGDGFGGRRGGGGMGFGFFSPFDLLWPRPYGFYGGSYFSPPPAMSLPEAIFSFVFGDGDPNATLRAARVRLLAGVIRANGGAVVAEQLAPFLDPPESTTSDGAAVDESWILLACAELGGRPEVTEDGTIVYVFDDLQVSAVESNANLLLADARLGDLEALSAPELAALGRELRAPTKGAADAPSLRAALRDWAADANSRNARSAGAADYLEERPVPFSNAEDGQLLSAAFLGLLNLGGCVYLGNLLAGIPAGVLLPAWLTVLSTFYPALLLYAVSYVAIPAVRYARLGAENEKIDKRNRARKLWSATLGSGAQRVAAKLKAAKRYAASLKIVTDDDIAYDSGKSLDAQPKAAKLNPDNKAMDDFDKRLGGGGGGE